MKKNVSFITSITISITALGILMLILTQNANGIDARSFIPYPYAEYQTVLVRKYVEAPKYIDHDNSSFYLDPSDESVLNNLIIQNSAKVIRVQGRTNPHNSLSPAGTTIIDSIHAKDRIYMHGTGATGNQARGVHDIAEGIAGINCTAGDVVVIHKNLDATVQKTTLAYDTGVAGIISTEPRIYILQQDKHVPLAIAGLVPCKVTNENGPIKKGDLLVTSSLPGHAMKADLKKITPGMVIGKALEHFTPDSKEPLTGSIIVLINAR